MEFRKIFTRDFNISSVVLFIMIVLVLFTHSIFLSLVNTMPGDLDNIAMLSMETQELTMEQIDAISELAATLKAIFEYFVYDFAIISLIIILLTYISNAFLFGAYKVKSKKFSKKFFGLFKYFKKYMIYTLIVYLSWFLLNLLVYNILRGVFPIFFILSIIGLYFKFSLVTVNVFTKKQKLAVFIPSLKQFLVLLVLPIIILFISFLAYIPFIGVIIFWLVFLSLVTFSKVLIHKY